MGLGELLWYRHSPAALDRAIDHLRRAAERGNTAALVDLAVAHHQRAMARGTALDRVEALSAAERAVISRPADAAAAFNRAWLLDEMGLLGLAVGGWDHYLSLDDDPAWRAEADAHRMRSLDRAGRVGAEREARRRILLEGFAAEAAAGAGKDPQLAREVAYGPLLERWMDFEGDRGDVVQRINLLGDRLADGSIAGLAEALSRSGERGSRAPIEAVRFLLEGERLLQAGRAEEATTPLRRAHALAAPGPLGHWVRLTLSAALFSDGEYDLARALASVPHASEVSGLPVVLGRGDWVVGLVALRGGDYANAWRHLRSAADLYSLAGEAGNRAFLDLLVAESLKHLGRYEDSWRARLDALQYLSEVGPSQRLHSTLWEAGDAADRLGKREVARLFLDAAVEVAAALPEPHLQAEAYLKRAEHHWVHRDSARAAADLESARPLLSFLPSGEQLRIARAQYWAVEGSLAIRTDPGRAAAIYDSLLDHQRSRGDGLGLVEALRGRGRALLRGGAHVEYEETLEEVLAVLGDQGESLGGGEGGSAFVGAARGALSEIVGYWGVDRRDAVRALRADQRGRSFVLRRGQPLPESEDALLRAIPPGVRIIQYAVLEDRLLRWTLSRDGLDMIVLPTARRDIEAQASAFLREIKSRTASAVEAGEVLAASLGLEAALEGVAAGDTGESQVAIIPDGFLARIPFAALPVGPDRRFLVELHPVVVAPHLAFLLEVLATEQGRAGERTGRVLLVGAGAVDTALLPSLVSTPLTEEELRGLAQMHARSTLLLGPDAQREPLFREMPLAELFHYAGHAVHDPLDAAGSHLVLSLEDAEQGADLLTARELDAMLVSAPRLVILSACSSAVPSDALAGGFWGLGAPFLRKGSSVVVGSLWAVDDEGALRLQVEFHGAWLDGLDSAEALRRAQLALLRDPDPRVAAPATWAAFQGLGIAL
jgi:hypothetical protein